MIWSTEFEPGLLIRTLRTIMGLPPQTQATWQATSKADGIKLSSHPRYVANQSHIHMPRQYESGLSLYSEHLYCKHSVALESIHDQDCSESSTNMILLLL